MLAYLDAGTGSMIIGVVAAGAAGAGVAIKSTLGRFRRSPKSDAAAGDAADSDTTVDEAAPAPADATD